MDQRGKIRTGKKKYPAGAREIFTSPAVEPTHHAVQWIPAFFTGGKAVGA
jgi:hypothetical protein